MKVNQSISLGDLLRAKLDRISPLPARVPCKHCGKPTFMTSTKLCDPCWEVNRIFEGLSFWKTLKIWWRVNRG